MLGAVRATRSIFCFVLSCWFFMLGRSLEVARFGVFLCVVFCFVSIGFGGAAHAIRGGCSLFQF